jgi:hypothetical protein
MPKSNKVPLFDGTDFPYWKVRIQAYMESINDLVWVVASTNNLVIGTEAERAELKKWEPKARNAIFEVITKDVFLLTDHDKSSHEI